jgi:hypothetical protein
MRIVEVPIPTFYGDEICRVNGIPYAFNCVRETAAYALGHRLIARPALRAQQDQTLEAVS